MWTDDSPIDQLGAELGLGEIRREKHPTWRRFTGKIFELLADAGARVIVLDVHYDVPSIDPSCDEDMIRGIDYALARRVSVVFATQDWFKPTAPRWRHKVQAGATTLSSTAGAWIGDVAVARQGLHDTGKTEPSMILHALAAQRVPGSIPVATIHPGSDVLEVRYVESINGALVESSTRDIVPVRIQPIDPENQFAGIETGDLASSIVSPAWSKADMDANTISLEELARKDPVALEKIRGDVVLVARCMLNVDPDEIVDQSPDPVSGELVWNVYGHASSIGALIANKGIIYSNIAVEWGIGAIAAMLGVGAGSIPRRRGTIVLAALGLTAAFGICSVLISVWGGMVLLAVPSMAALLVAAGMTRWLAPRAVR
jgi:CHASE2 domain-containing sensor protein